MRAKQVTVPSFDELYDLAPELIKDYIDRCKDTQQGTNWHPEGNTYVHIRLVYDRARATNNINLALASFFHDLGKVDTSAPNKHGGISALGHELVSARLAKRYSDWIEEMGADAEAVYLIVLDHMKIKQYPKMRAIKQKRMQEHPYWNELNQFTKFDNMKTLTDEEMNRYK